MIRIYSVSGFVNSGKTTVSKILEEHGYQHITYAGALKSVLTMLFDWDPELIEGVTLESRKWRDVPQPWWSEKLGIPDFTPRKAMTMIGTGCFREHFSPNIWTAIVENKFNSNDRKYIVGDARYINELDLVKNYGGKTIRIRAEEPTWATIGYNAARGDEAAIQEMKNLNIHPTEWAWLAYDFDYEIKNEKKGLSHLATEVEKTLNLGE